MGCFLDSVITKIGWDGLTALSSFALVMTAILTAIYARAQIKDFRREAKISRLIELVQQFEQEPLSSFRRKLGDSRVRDGKLTPLNLDDPPEELHDILNFFEHMGFLLSGDYIEIDGVSVEFHFWIFNIWADARTLVKHEQIESAVYYEHLEKMVVRLTEIERRRVPSFKLPTEDEIVDFYQGEAHLPPNSPIPRYKRKAKGNRSSSQVETQ
jgi:hypothetical protein